MFPPLLGRSAGRPKKQRIRGCMEKIPPKKVKCRRCGGFGLFTKTCKEPMQPEEEETALDTNKR